MTSVCEESHPLEYKWTLYFKKPASQFKGSSSTTTKDEWSALYTEICTVGTVEQYWTMCHNIPKPSMLPARTTYYFFKDGIKPAWEDPMNEGGGQVDLKSSKKTYSINSEIIFFDLLLLTIGNQLPFTEFICGIGFNKTKDLIEIWTKKDSPNEKLKDSIFDKINEMLKLRELPPLESEVISYYVRKGK